MHWLNMKSIICVYLIIACDIFIFWLSFLFIKIIFVQQLVIKKI